MLKSCVTLSGDGKTVAIGAHGNYGNGIYSYNSSSNKLDHVAQYLDNKDSGNQS